MTGSGTRLESLALFSTADWVPVAEMRAPPTAPVLVSDTPRARVKVELASFPVVGDPEFARTYEAYHERFRRYRVDARFVMSLPSCRLVGPHLVATMGDRYIRETTRSQRSFRERSLFEPLGDGVFELLPGAQVEQVDEPAVVLGGRNVKAYFHWMIDIVPRLMAAHEHEALRSLPVVMRPLERGFQREMLGWLGVTPEFVTAPIVEAEHAFIPSSPIHRQGRARYAPELLAAARAFRERHVPAMTRKPAGRIYVSRRDATTRRIDNEAAVEEMLRARGFECVVLSELPVQDQIGLFSHADVVVAPHGGGLVNLLFCKRKARVVEIFPRGLLTPSPFWTLASLARLRYTMLPATGVRTRPAGPREFIDRDMDVDVDALAALIDGFPSRA